MAAYSLHPKGILAMLFAGSFFLVVPRGGLLDCFSLCPCHCATYFPLVYTFYDFQQVTRGA